MVVMITPPAFANIGYKTYVIFAVINTGASLSSLTITSQATNSLPAMVPCVYFFFPETAYRSLEEMDEIFHKTTNPFDVVKVANELPHRYDKRGNLLISYEETEEAQMYAERRRSSVVAHQAPRRSMEEGEKDRVEHQER